MKVIAWIVLIFYVLSGLYNFIKMFTEETVIERVNYFIGVIATLLVCLLSIYVIKL